MSVECGICERDARSGHAPDCPRNPENRASGQAVASGTPENPAATPAPAMAKFDGPKPLKTVLAACKRKSWNCSTELYDQGSDYVTLDFYHGNAKIKTLFDPAFGRFIATYKGKQYSHDTPADGLPWYDALLKFLYKPQPRTLPRAAQWAAIAAELGYPHGVVRMKIDGFEVTYAVILVKRKLEIMTYVNGIFEGIWMKGEAPESRFFRQKTRFIHTPQVRKDLAKLCGGKRASKKDLADINRQITLYDPYWPSPLALRRHLVGSFKEIELVSIGYQPSTPAAVKEAFND